MTVRVFAPAKVNLALHITGQRADGYHLVDTLVGFGPAHDTLTVTPGNMLSLTVEGPEAAGVPADTENLVLRAAKLLAGGRGAAFTLEKYLPVASGIGGGSADAAAALRAALALWEDFDFADTSLDALRPFAEEVAALGADVEMCLLPCPLRAQGVGNKIEWIKSLPPLPVLLMNPRVPVSTAAVFTALPNKGNAPLPTLPPDWPDVSHFCDWLKTTRNDLEPPAIALAPEIAAVRDALAESEAALFARMSGSGATCFAIYPSEDAVSAAGRKLHRDHPEWWIAGGWLGNKLESSLPKIT